MLPFDMPLDASQDKKPVHLALDRKPPINSAHLFEAGDEVLISHEGEQYRLRRTRNGKLILTK